MLLSGGHSRRIVLQAMSFSGGAVAGGAIAYGLLGAVGGLNPHSSLAAGTAVLLAGSAWTLAWHLQPNRVPLPSPHRQLKREYTETPFTGALLFGVTLGLGVVTIVRSPLVWVGAAAVMASGSLSSGILYGLFFGGTRAVRLLAPLVRRSEVRIERSIQLLAPSRHHHVFYAAATLAVFALSAAGLVAWYG